MRHIVSRIPAGRKRMRCGHLRPQCPTGAGPFVPRMVRRTFPTSAGLQRLRSEKSRAVCAAAARPATSRPRTHPAAPSEPADSGIGPASTGNCVLRQHSGSFRAAKIREKADFHSIDPIFTCFHIEWNGIFSFFRRRRSVAAASFEQIRLSRSARRKRRILFFRVAPRQNPNSRSLCARPKETVDSHPSYSRPAISPANSDYSRLGANVRFRAIVIPLRSAPTGPALGR